MDINIISLIFLIGKRCLKIDIFQVFLIWLFWITPAYANAGIPMLGAIWPPAIISLWVVIFIESR